MIYKIYPVQEKKWFDTWKRIKQICKQTKSQIVEVDVVLFKDFITQEKKDNRFIDLGHLACGYKDDQFVTIIKIAKQQKLLLTE